MTGDSMNMDAPSSVSIQTSVEPIPSMPEWFGEVALIAHTLTRLSLLSEISEQVRFSRKRFGTFEVIDFVVVLMGYALSGELTLAAYYERLQPFATPFMALFGRERVACALDAQSLSCGPGPGECGSATWRVLAGCAGSPGTRAGRGWCVGSARATMRCLRSGRHQTGCTAACSASGSGFAPSTAAVASGLCARLHGAQAGGSRADPHHALAGPYPSVVGHVWQSGQCR